MNRRRLLKGCGGALGLGALGTVGFIELNDSEVQSTEDIRLSPGSSGVLTIHWSNVDHIIVRSANDRPLTNAELIEVELDDDKLSPHPDMVLTSYPPAWVWDSPTEVEMQLPIAVAPDASPGEYPITIAASGPGDHLVGAFEVALRKSIGIDTDVGSDTWTFSITVTE